MMFVGDLMPEEKVSRKARCDYVPDKLRLTIMVSEVSEISEFQIAPYTGTLKLLALKCRANSYLQNH
jgi:hypothetical protein